jgi:uncharacterized membrane protein
MIGEDNSGFEILSNTANGTSPSQRNGFARVLERNITSLIELRKREEKEKGLQERIADGITNFTGSMTFVYIHLALIGGWVLFNLGWFGITPFDPFPFGLLTMIGSLEAIFLSTFVLITQNRMAAADNKRAELDLQVSLLAEHEVTQLVILVDAIAERLGIPRDGQPHVEEAKNEVDPVTVLQAIDAHEQAAKPNH